MFPCVWSQPGVAGIGRAVFLVSPGPRRWYRSRHSRRDGMEDEDYIKARWLREFMAGGFWLLLRRLEEEDVAEFAGLKVQRAGGAGGHRLSGHGFFAVLGDADFAVAHQDHRAPRGWAIRETEAGS